MLRQSPRCRRRRPCPGLAAAASGGGEGGDGRGGRRRRWRCSCLAGSDAGAPFCASFPQLRNLVLCILKMDSGGWVFFDNYGLRIMMI